MAVKNGLLSGAILSPVSWARGHRLRRGPARAMSALGLKHRADRGHLPTINSSYRTLAGQWRVWRQYGPSRAAVPGFSNHGLGKAVDLGGLGGFDGAGYRWMRKHGHHFGWNNPPRYRRNGAKPESWHFEYSWRGDESRQVEALQRLLRTTRLRNRRDYTGAVDRLWGDGTQTAAGKFLHRVRKGWASKRNIKRLQRILKRAGTYKGRIDGKWGPKSNRAWFHFRGRYYYYGGK